MTKEADYKKQLRELYEMHKGKELEAALGITIRSVQNYLKEEDPRTPSPEIQEKIRETFANHCEGRPLDYQIAEEGGGSIDKLIQSNIILAEANKRLADAHYNISVTNKELMLMVKASFSFHKPMSTGEEHPLVEEAADTAAEVRRTGRIGSFVVPKKGAPKGSSNKTGK
jgi:transcriptional regulator with XRE-family HTH domain